MEVFFIFLMGATLFWQYGGETKKDIAHIIINNKKGALKYLGSAAMLALTLSVLPSILLSIYMRHHGFFAFEVFGSEEGGMRIISLNVLFNFMLLSVFLMAGAIFWSTGVPKILTAIAFMSTLSILGLLLFTAYASEKYELVVATVFISLVIGGYIYFWTTNSISGKIDRWWVPLLLSGIAIVVPILFHSYAAALTGNALFQMRVGGMDVTLSEPLKSLSIPSQDRITGKLLLRTSELYYLQIPTPTEKSKFTILIVSSESVAISYNFSEK